MQFALQFDETKPGDDLAALCAFLRNLTNWASAQTISKRLGFTERKIRDLASKSKGLIVSGPGSPGYKHVTRCTGEEIDRIALRLQAQAKIMSTRAGDIRAKFHKTDTL